MRAAQPHESLPDRSSKHRPPKEYFEWGVSAVLAICAIVVTTVLLTGRGRDEPPTFQLPTAPEPIGTSIAGDRARARVGLIVFSDYQCPFCGRLARDVFPALRRLYVETGQLVIDFRQLPIQSIHPFALPAARASLCAGRQEKFWELHDRLFAVNADLTPHGLRASLTAVHGDPVQWEICLKEPDIDQHIDRDVRTARRLRITSTPFSLVGVTDGDGITLTGWVKGARSLEDFSREIDRALATAQAR